jgi:adenylosuccinate synthase
MDRKIVLLSGEIGAGKTKLAKLLVDRYGFRHVKTSEYLKQRRQDGARDKLQAEGAELDKGGGDWVIRYFIDLCGMDPRGLFVIDSVRIKEQIDFFRKGFGSDVIHVHLKASPETLKERFIERQLLGEKPGDVGQDYEQIKNDQREKENVPLLDLCADISLNTDSNTPLDVLTRVVAALKLNCSLSVQAVDVLVGGQYGSEGKGQVIAYLAPEYQAILRSGGPNAGHSVFAIPEKHKFHHIPSGANAAPKSHLILGPGMVIGLNGLLNEIRQFNIEPERLSIHPNATVISDSDLETEKEWVAKIGSTGQGVGSATANNIIRRGLNDDSQKAKKFPELRSYIRDTREVIEEILRSGGRILVEGTQGTGLSLHHGPFPKVTSRDTTVNGVLAEQGIGPRRVSKIFMVVRTYPIRVAGESGDFENKELTLEEIAERSRLPAEGIRKTEITTTTEKQRRIAEFSWEQFRKSCELNTPTDIVLTFADYLDAANENARRFEQLTPETRQFVEELERVASVPVSLIGTRFEYRSFIDRRKP